MLFATISMTEFNQPWYKVVRELGCKTLYISWSQEGEVYSNTICLYKGKKFTKMWKNEVYNMRLVKNSDDPVKLIYFRNEKVGVRWEKTFSKGMRVRVYTYP